MKKELSRAELMAKLQAAERRIAELEQTRQTADAKVDAVSTEDNAQRQALRLSLALEAAQAGIWEWNLRTNKDFWSNELWAVYGLEPHSCEPSYQAWRNIIHPEDRELAEQAVQHAAQTGSELKSEWRVVAANGAVRWVMSRGRPIFDEQGQVQRIVGVAIDITERKRIEDKLRMSEARYRLISENAADVIWVMNPASGQFTYVSPSVEKLRGYTPAEIMAQPVSAALTPESLKLVQESMSVTLPEFVAQGSGTRSFVHEVDQPCKDGSIVRTEVTTTYMFNAQGEVEIVGVSRNITERRQAEKAMREKVLRLSLALEAAQAGIWEWDLRTNKNIWSDELWVLYGLKPRSCEPSYEAWRNTIHPEDREPAEQAVQLAAKNGTELKVEWRVLQEDGSIRWVMSRGKPVRDTSGHIERFLGIVLDITERKRAELAFQASEGRYRSLFENMMNGFAYCQMLFDQGRPHDFIYLDVNQAFETLTGLRRVTGKKVSEVIPGIRQNDPELLKIYGRVAVTGVPETFEVYLESLQMWFSVSVYSPQPEYFVAIFDVITERKQVEQALRISQENFERAFEANPAALAITRLVDGKVIKINAAYSRMIGYEPDEILGRSGSDLNMFLDSNTRQEYVQLLQKEGRVRDHEMQLRLKSGAIRNMIVYMEPISFDGENCILTALLDITKRKRAEEKLRESEARFSTIFHASPVGKHIFRLSDGRSVEANEAYLALVGYTPEELIGYTAAELNLFVNPETRRGWIQALRNGQRVQNQDADIRRKNGEIRHVLASLDVIDLNNEPMVLVIASDITDRKRAEEALWESEQRLRAATKPSNMIFAQTDIEARYTWIHNPHPDFDPKAALGKTDIDLADNQGSRTLFEAKRQVIATGVGIKTEIVFPVSDGPRSYDVFIDPLYNVTRRLIGVTTSAYDITEQKRVENELRRSNAELEQFAYVASHDLQEPLRAVAGMVQLLRQRYKGQLDDRADEYIQHAVEASARMQALINDLLDYSRLDRFGKPFEPIPAEKSLQAALANLQISIQESQAHITYDPLPTIMADPTQLIRVFQNLTGNAIKFRGAETPRIHIGAAQEPHVWRFSVSDNGIGIEPQYFERIFLVFQRLHTRREYPGTGIGLSLCKKIIERHGGRIWVESQPGQGTTVYFTIPKRA